MGNQVHKATLEITMDEFGAMSLIARIDLEKEGLLIEVFPKDGKFYLSSPHPLSQREWQAIKKRLLR